MSMIYRSKASGKLVKAKPMTSHNWYEDMTHKDEDGYFLEPVNQDDFIWRCGWCDRKEFFESFTPDLRLVG